MTKLFLFGLTIILFVACQNKPQRYFAESPEINTLKSGITAYESGDWDKWKSHFADTAKVYVNSPDPLTIEKRAEGLKAMADAMSSYGFNHEKEYIEMVLDKDDETWVYYWAMHKGTLAANNKVLAIPVHLAVRFADGKIIEEHVYFDGTEMNKEMAALANMTDSDKTIYSQIETLIDIFTNKQDFSVLGHLIADGHVRYINDVKVASGPTELQASMAPYFTGFPDFNIKLLHKSPIMDNAIFIHWKMTGTNDGAFAGSQATGKKVDVNGLSRLHFNEEGKLDTEHIHFDQLDLMQQLGRSLN